MKGCLVLQRRFAYIGHELGKLLKERHGIDEFCAFVSLRESYEFLKNQKDIRYTDILLDEDVQKRYVDEPLDMEYIRKFESTYGNVRDMIKVDRVIALGQLVREYPHARSPYTEGERLRIAQVYAKSVEAFLAKERPDFILTYQPGALWMLMMYKIAKQKGIPVLTIVLPTTKNRVALSEEYGSLSWVDECFKRDLAKPLSDVEGYEEARKFIEEFRTRPVVYSDVYTKLIQHGTLKQFRFLVPLNMLSTLRSIFFLLYNWLRSSALRTDYNALKPHWYLYDRVRRKLRNLVGVNDLYDPYDSKKSFAFYALHFEPELSVLLLSEETDQRVIIAKLAAALPEEMLLYVKEHPQMTPYRTRAYYKQLKKIPNVRLVRPELSSFDIMRSARLVSTITGAAGWEAALLGRPVLTFGNVFYNALPSVGHVTDMSELPRVVRQTLERPVPREEAERYLAALLRESAECDILSVWESEIGSPDASEKLAGFATLLARKIKLVTTRDRR
ncbi:hypothetical protein HYW59_01930 [Candidatus Kaiserbacteria bacterium]|nr:hypothetical protein [Candidatus Kaiserbacteria bacterium]